MIFIEDDFILLNLLNVYIKHSDRFLKRLEKYLFRLKRQHLIKQNHEDKLPFIIMPSHFDLPGIPIILKSGPAFGAGNHPTTIYCLKLLYELYKDFTQLPEYVLDAGTGTGILAIAAARLGTEKVLAIDISHDAVSTAKHNVTLNHLANIEVQSLCITEVEGKFDLILANLDETLLKKIYNKLGELLNNKGWLIISGMTVPNDKVIIPLFLKNGLRLIKNYNKIEWCTAMFRKQLAS